MQGPEWGWGSTEIIGLFVAAVLFLGAFYVTEFKVREPLIEIDLFKNKTFSSSNLVIFTGQFTKIAAIVFGALYLQQVLKMDPLKAGVALFPALVPIPIMAVLAGNATDKYGARYPVLIGLILASIALIFMGLTSESDSYMLIVPTFFLWGISVAWMFAPALVAVMNSVPAEKQGQASGIVLSAQIFGATIGLAILSASLNEFHSFRIVFILTAAVAFFTSIISWMYLDKQRRT